MMNERGKIQKNTSIILNIQNQSMVIDTRIMVSFWEREELLRAELEIFCILTE